MRILKIGLIIILLLQFNSLFAEEKLSEIVPNVPPEAKSPIDPVFDSVLQKVIADIFHDNYESSMATFDSLIKVYPNHPAPYFFKAAAYQSWMSSYRINNFQKEVEDNVNIVIEKSDSLLKIKNDPWIHFYLGAGYGYRGFNRFRKYNWIGAYRDAQRGIDNFEKALAIDSSLYDVYLGLGSYYYWRTAKSKFLRIITFWMSDKRELGLEQLKFAMEHGRYAVNEASYVLLACYYDAERYRDALSLVNKLIDKKEQPNLTDLYFKGMLAAHYKDWKNTQILFTEIYNRIRDYKYPSIGFQVECQYWIAKSLSEKGQYEAAYKLADEALKLSEERNPDLEIEGHISSFDDIKNELKDLYEELQKRIN